MGENFLNSDEVGQIATVSTRVRAVRMAALITDYGYKNILLASTDASIVLTTCTFQHNNKFFSQSDFSEKPLTLVD